jgi:hypothetical protein
MIIKNHRNPAPPWNTTLWKYMSFEKFLDIILNNRLYFSNATRFSDKNEGTLSEKTKTILLNSFIKEGLSKNDASMQVTTAQLNIDYKKNHSFVSCWTMDHDESYALWKIYLGGSKSGIAIKTNLKKLVDSIKRESLSEDCYLEKVVYNDYINDPIDIIGALTTKGKSYKYESELRLILLWRLVHNEFSKSKMIRAGITISVEPAALIDQIYLSPFGGRAFNNIVKQTLEIIDPIYSQKIKLSEIDDE